jgi:predicted ATP-grasp superfamily ATP-dependent carboligase
MDLVKNGVVVTDAIKYVQGKMDHLKNQAKKILQDIKHKQEQTQEAEESETKDKTTNTVF